MKPGSPLAVGSRSIVYEWGPDAVVKGPLPSTPDNWIESEARSTSIVRRCGAPVPELLGLEIIDGRVVSLYERIGGRSMWSHMVERSLLAALDVVPPIDEHRLCDGHLHPGNIIMGTDGPVIVDWFDVARGPPSADVARSLP